MNEEKKLYICKSRFSALWIESKYHCGSLMLGLTALNLFRVQYRSRGGLSQWPMAYIACFEFLLPKGGEVCPFSLSR